MVIKKKPVKNVKEKAMKKKVQEEEAEDEGGTSLDDAFGDDEDVEYAEDHRRISQRPASKKSVKAKKKVEEDLDEMIEEAAETVQKIGGEQSAISITASKPIAQVKKGDTMKIDDVDVEVDAHYALMDHGTTKEMAIEVFDKTDKDYQIRYFSDQVESTLDVYQLQEILYVKRVTKSVSW